jgi:hypothetical protein
VEVAVGSGRRSAVARGIVAMLAVCLAVAACGGDDEEGTPATQAPSAVTGEFVGAASDQETYVALYASKGQSAEQIEVVAYVCNRRVDQQGALFAEWFTGTATADNVDLTSQTGKAHLRAALEQGRARGTADLPDGRSVTFEAARSEGGPAGLFEVNVDDQGNLVGSSRGGKTLKLSSFQRDGEPGYTGTITLPGGQAVPYELFVRGGVVTKADVAGMGTPRTIILPDGSSRGILDPIARKGKETTG